MRIREARQRNGCGLGIALATGPGPPLSPWWCRWRRPGRLGDNHTMASDDTRALSWQLFQMVMLDGARPSRKLGWVSPVAPVVTQAAVGAGHWACGRRRRALAAWTRAAGFGLIAWGLGTEAPPRAELDDLLRKLGAQAPAADGTDTNTARRRTRDDWLNLAAPVAGMIIAVPWDLRHPRRLTVLAIAMEAQDAVFHGLRAAWAVQRRRPRIAVGSALVAAGSVARLRAAKAEPLR
jgi:hypothetical protein